MTPSEDSPSSELGPQGLAAQTGTADTASPVEPLAGRVTPMGGSANFRHMGGYAAAGGRKTRATQLFRTGWLHLTEAEGRRFRDHKIRRVFDFRNAAERTRQPLALPDGTPATELPIEQGSMAGYLQTLPAGLSSASDTRRAMTSMYREMVRDGASSFETLLKDAAASDGPLLVACTLGKDRTGVAAALLLHVLGVGRDEIFEDYLISASVYEPTLQDLYARMQFESRGIDFDVVRDILTVNPEYLAGAWQEMEEISGSVDEFVHRRLRVSEDMKARLRESYTA